jgi:hypothetical protein
MKKNYNPPKTIFYHNSRNCSPCFVQISTFHIKNSSGGLPPPRLCSIPILWLYHCITYEYSSPYRYGFIIAVTTIDNIGVGAIQAGRGFVVYPVKYKVTYIFPFCQL